MESIHGSLYVEVESIFGIFCGGAATANAAAAADSPTKRSNNKNHGIVNSSGSSDSSKSKRNNTASGESDKSNKVSTTAGSSEDVEEIAFAPLQHREISSHSPFGTAQTGTSIFAEKLTETKNKTTQKAKDGAVSPDNTGTPHKQQQQQQREGSTPGVSTSTFPLPIIEAPYPPSLFVHYGAETHLIDVHSPSVASAAAAGGFGGLSPSQSAGPGSFLISPTTGCTGTAASTPHLTAPHPTANKSAAVGASGLKSTAADAADPLQGQASPRVSNGASRGSSAGSSHGSLPSMAAVSNAAVWEAVLAITDDAESEAEESGDSPQTPRHAAATTVAVSPTSPPRSFHVDSASSATENDEFYRASQPTGRGGPSNGTRPIAIHANPDTVGENYNNTSAVAAKQRPLPTSGAAHSTHFLTQASPCFTSPACQAGPPRNASLSWLAEYVRNDSNTLSAITWVGPRPHPPQNASAASNNHHNMNSSSNNFVGVKSDSAVPSAAFAAAWYARMFPENAEEERNVLMNTEQALYAAKRGLRLVSRHLTAALFPLGQRFSFLNATIEVKSRAAFDLQDAIRLNTRREKGSHKDGSSNDGGLSGADAECLILRVATPAELKKARKAPHRPSSASLTVSKKAKAVDEFFDRIRRSFTSRATKEKAAASPDNSFSSEGELLAHGSNTSPPPPLSPSRQQQRQGKTSSPPVPGANESHADESHHHFFHHGNNKEAGSSNNNNNDNHNSANLSNVGSGGGGSRDTFGVLSAKKEKAKSDSFAVRLHLSRLLSPTILAWMKKGRRDASSPSGSSAEEMEMEERGGARASVARTTPSNARGSGGRGRREDPDRPAVFCKSVYLPLPPPTEAVEGGSCLVMMVKVNVLFKPGFDTAEPF